MGYPPIRLKMYIVTFPFCLPTCNGYLSSQATAFHLSFKRKKRKTEGIPFHCYFGFRINYFRDYRNKDHWYSMVVRVDFLHSAVFGIFDHRLRYEEVVRERPASDWLACLHVNRPNPSPVCVQAKADY